MPDNKTLNHTTWDLKYHVVLTLKYRRQALYKELRGHLGEVSRSLAQQKESLIEERHLMPDPVHMLISIPQPAIRASPRTAVLRSWCDCIKSLPCVDH